MGGYVFQNPGSFLCLYARADGSRGSAVIVWDCNGGANEKWLIGQDSVANGAKLILRRCNNGWNQAFQRHMPYQLENTPYGDVIDAPNDIRGPQKAMWGKSGGKNQQWEWL
ncbi:ricin-type beta-trefoil lectin domain protein [Streptomyces sp. NPDC056402]|uniref:ricin-type beta-trefoil lectin domain protein n=1 Tax=Streptomyces sp. NPDC056402 TaxID=3345810 RepID=UPI0035D80DE4